MEFYFIIKVVHAGLWYLPRKRQGTISAGQKGAVHGRFNILLISVRMSASKVV